MIIITTTAAWRADTEVFDSIAGTKPEDRIMGPEDGKHETGRRKSWDRKTRNMKRKTEIMGPEDGKHETGRRG